MARRVSTSSGAQWVRAGESRQVQSGAVASRGAAAAQRGAAQRAAQCAGAVTWHSRNERLRHKRKAAAMQKHWLTSHIPSLPSWCRWRVELRRASLVAVGLRQNGAEPCAGDSRAAVMGSPTLAPTAEGCTGRIFRRCAGRRTAQHTHKVRQERGRVNPSGGTPFRLNCSAGSAGEVPRSFRRACPLGQVGA